MVPAAWYLGNNWASSPQNQRIIGPLGCHEVPSPGAWGRPRAGVGSLLPGPACISSVEAQGLRQMQPTAPAAVKLPGPR